MFNDFTPESVVFTNLYKNKLGGKAVYMNTQSGQKVLIQLPPVRAPFGLSQYKDPATEKVTVSLPLSLDDEEIQKVFTDLDARILKHVSEHSKEYLGQQLAPDVLKVLYSPIVRPSADEKYAPQLKLKVGPDTVCYDVHQNVVPLESIEKGSSLHTIIEVNQIWIVDKKFGVSVRVKQVMKTPSTQLNGFAFKNVSADEIDIPADD